MHGDDDDEEKRKCAAFDSIKFMIFVVVVARSHLLDSLFLFRIQSRFRNQLYASYVLS